MSSTKQYFLGANSRYGFHSLYSSFCKAEDGCFLYVIKGGPGCGKSSFMRCIGSAAEKEGLDCEYILCSGDPDSIDGVFIPALGVGYVDGTSPHSIDVAHPGCGGMYLDLGRYYNSAALRHRLNEILELNRQYKGLYNSAYSSIAVGAAAMPRYMSGIWGGEETEKVDKKVQGLCKREFGKKKSQSIIKERFIDAVSCKGHCYLHQDIEDGFERTYILDNKFGLGNLYLQRLLNEASGRCEEIIVCRDGVDPKFISAIMFPHFSLALICSQNGRHELRHSRHIRLDSLISKDNTAHIREQIRSSQRLSESALSLATKTLAEAKAIHDKIEAIYNPHVDFDGVYREAQRHIELLFG